MLSGLRQIWSQRLNNSTVVVIYCEEVVIELRSNVAWRWDGNIDELFISSSLVGSSGKSLNIVNGAKHAKDLELTVIAFTGFSRDNPVKAIADVNFYVDRSVYYIIKNTHRYGLQQYVICWFMKK